MVVLDARCDVCFEIGGGWRVVVAWGGLNQIGRVREVGV